MKTTILHVATCLDCRQATVHQSVVEHGPGGRAVSSHHACEPCGSRATVGATITSIGP